MADQGSLNQLLQWSIENSEDARNDPNQQDRDPSRGINSKMIAELMGGPSDADLMREAMSAIVAPLSQVDLENKLIAWDNFEQLIEQLDNANNMEPMGLWQPLIQQLESEIADCRAMAAWCCSTAVQNNVKSQERLQALGGVSKLAKQAVQDEDKTARKKAVNALSSHVRNFQPGLDELESALPDSVWKRKGLEAGDMDSVDELIQTLRDQAARGASCSSSSNELAIIAPPSRPAPAPSAIPPPIPIPPPPLRGGGWPYPPRLLRTAAVAADILLRRHSGIYCRRASSSASPATHPSSLPAGAGTRNRRGSETVGRRIAAQARRRRNSHPFVVRHCATARACAVRLVVRVVIVIPAFLRPDGLRGAVIVARRGAGRGRRIAGFFPLRLLGGEVDVEPFLAWCSAGRPSSIMRHEGLSGSLASKERGAGVAIGFGRKIMWPLTRNVRYSTRLLTNLTQGDMQNHGLAILLNPTLMKYIRRMDNASSLGEKKGKRSSLYETTTQRPLLGSVRAARRRAVGVGLRGGVAVDSVRKRDFDIEPAGDRIACALVDDGVEETAIVSIAVKQLHP
ncbi:hypothetical protein KC367_g236 [Hortaea werneckii]|nr:hypothetical protein KC367_g236 [Hortaea werneckii]